MCVQLAILFKGVVCVNTATKQYLKRAGERVLVDTGGAVKPKINVDIESWPNVDGHRRIAKVCLNIHLLRQVGSCLDPTNDLPGIEAVAELQLGKGLRSNSR